MIHERFDIERWKAVFPLARLRDASRGYLREERRRGRLPDEALATDQAAAAYIERSVDWYIFLLRDGDAVVGPYPLAALEQLREERLAMAPDVERVPTDVFVFARGEPPRREVTKVGGLPYWPAGRAWPRAASGAPLTFVAQFNFADSRDLAGEVPGDVLLIFNEPEYLSREEMQRVKGPGWVATRDRYGGPGLTGMHFAWLSLGINDLIRPGEVPATDWVITPCYGQIHRTYDCILGDPESEEYQQHPGVVCGTKIGGIPCEVQEDPRLFLPGRFLCTLGETLPDLEHPYPYVNVVEPLGLGADEEQYALRWGDAGLMHLTVADDGHVYYTIDSS